MFRRIWALALTGLMVLSPISSAWAQTLGPVSSYEELCGLLLSAQDGDIILLSGDIDADSSKPLSGSSSVRLQAQGSATVSGLHLQDASVSFVGVTLKDGLTIDGTSHILLGNNVTITGSDGNAALSFSGNGALIIEQGCDIEGGTGAPGLSIRHNGGEFYSSIEGSITGGNGKHGGAGMIVSPLKEGGAMMITGSIQGGSGTVLGGHALNLYELSGNAYITVDGTLQGGDGTVGGDGIQLVAASGNVNVGIGGQVKGGSGESHGGNAMILLNAEGSSSVSLSGHFSGGDALGSDAQPGTSLHLIGDSTSLRTRMDNCILEDGKKLRPSAKPTAEPTPEPVPESTSEPAPEPTPEPAPESTPEPSPESAPELQPVPLPAPTEEDILASMPEPMPDPTAEPEAPEEGALVEEPDMLEEIMPTEDAAAQNPAE